MARMVRWIIGVLLVGSVGASEAGPLIDPGVTSQLSGGHRARVLVELRTDQQGREASIARAQDLVLSRLPQSHSALLHRYSSIPLLSLEIDATALRALETMGDVVAAVKPDQPMRRQ